MAAKVREQKRQQRRVEILNTAQQVLSEKGYSKTTMLEVAQRAHASKATLYAWFGNKAGLFEALVKHNATQVNQALAQSIGDSRLSLPEMLKEFCRQLISLLLGEGSLVINRAAISEAAQDGALGALLIRKGREETLPHLLDYLNAQKRRGHLDFERAEHAAEALIGLAVGDLQVRRLLGVIPRPAAADIAERSRRATEYFLRIFGT